MPVKHLLSLGLLLSLLSACDRTEPTPVTTISLHTTADSPGIAPGYSIYVGAVRLGKGQRQDYVLQPYKQDQVDDTRVLIPALDPAHRGDTLHVAVGLPTDFVGYKSTATGFAQVDALVNGQVRQSIRVDKTTPSGRTPYKYVDGYLVLRDL